MQRGLISCINTPKWSYSTPPRLVLSSGSSERENEWGAQQAFVWHRGSSAHRVQWKTAAPFERTHGCPGRQGKACTHTFVFAAAHIADVTASQNKWKYSVAHVLVGPDICFDTVTRSCLFCLELPYSGPRELPETAWRIPPYQGQWDMNESPNHWILLICPISVVKCSSAVHKYRFVVYFFSRGREIFFFFLHLI